MLSLSSAPGKAILFGEHSVVYGKTAVAVALSDLRIFVFMVRDIQPCLFKLTIIIIILIFKGNIQ
jgi:mevalonate kinase